MDGYLDVVELLLPMGADTLAMDVKEAFTIEKELDAKGKRKSGSSPSSFFLVVVRLCGVPIGMAARSVLPIKS